MKKLILSALMIILFSLTACSSAAPEGAPIATKDQQTDVFIPVVEIDTSESDELVSGEVSEAYPDSGSESQNQEVEVVPQNASYPEPESEDVPELKDEISQEEANPVPQEQPTQVIKPTPRGDELVATNPSTVILSSGQLQLVELFAFW